MDETNDLNTYNDDVEDHTIGALLPFAEWNPMLAEAHSEGSFDMQTCRLDNVDLYHDVPMSLVTAVEWSHGVDHFVEPFMLMWNINRHSNYAYPVRANIGDTAAWQTFAVPSNMRLVYYWEHMHHLAQEFWIVGGDESELLPASLRRVYAPSTHNVSLPITRLGWDVADLQRFIRARGEVKCAFRNSERLVQLTSPNEGYYNFFGTFQADHNLNVCAKMRFKEGDRVTAVVFNANSPVDTFQHTHFHGYWLMEK